ncbi:MAG: response regulator [Solirubrobacterales bacterium]
MIRILIADDHALIREGLRKILEAELDIEILAEVGDGQGAINMARKHKPDVILMDVNMPGTDGITATKVILRELPDTKIVALTVCEDEQVVEMVKTGVAAYLLKDVAVQELVTTIRRVMAGEVVIHSRVASHIVRQMSGERKAHDLSLTRRERDVLEMVVAGHSNKEMADALFISEKTVKNHLTSIFRKLDVKDRTQAAVYALKHHLIKN